MGPLAFRDSMATIKRLTDSCFLVTTDSESVLFDPGSHTFSSGEIDLESIGDVTRVLITHEHSDHVSQEFVRWLVDRRRDLAVHSNAAVADILDGHGIAVDTQSPAGVSFEDVRHEVIPNGTAPPNRAFTIEGVFTHPGDSRQPTVSAQVLALPLMAPWGSATGAVEFARRLRPRLVVPAHDFYLSEGGRGWLRGMVKRVLDEDGIELMDLDWGEGFSI